MITGEKMLTWLYYFGVALMLASLPLSKYTMSISQFVLTGVFILDGIRKKDVISFYKSNGILKSILLTIPFSLFWMFSGIIRKFKAFFHRENAPAWIFSSLLLLHVIGLIFTTDMEYALKDLRVKLPILLLPLFLSTTGKIDRKAFPLMMYVFFAALLVASGISTYLSIARDATDIREVSPYISHIRLGLLIDIGVFAMIYMVLKKSDIHAFLKFLMGIASVWLVFFLVNTASMTGLAILIMTSGVMVIYLMYRKRKIWLKVAMTIGLFTIIVIVGIYVYGIWKDVYRVHEEDMQKMDRTTALGNPYWHDTTNFETENGHYVYRYISTDELREAWDNRSGYDYSGLDQAGQEIKYTIYRFLTSKGLRKDAEGLARLTDSEVELIERGVASRVYVDHNRIYVRIYKSFAEYKRYQESKDPTRRSLMQRLEYWKAARNIIKRSWLTGVGTGDMDMEFQKEYENMQTLLEKEFRWRSHNQFLAIFVAFGVLGVIWFLVTLIFPPVRMHKFHDYYYLTFFIIIVLSMLWEDTIESQAGVTIYAFFTSFYLFAKKFINVV